MPSTSWPNRYRTWSSPTCSCRKYPVSTCSTIKEQGLPVPVVIVSADIQETSKERCNTLGCENLNKPFTKEDLDGMLSSVLAAG